VPAIIATVGIPALIDWTGHYLMLNLYAGVTQLGKTYGMRQRVEGLGDGQARLRYVLRRALERWEYGAGLDYFGDDKDGHDT
jgi:hypothetical protein